MTGLVSHCAGLAAEAAVERHYRDLGARPLAQRWRAGGGEIDLILQLGDTVVFVEVKQARTVAAAAARLGAGQRDRLRTAAEAFLGTLPAGTDTLARFDVALVGRDGGFEVLENTMV